MNVGPSEIPFAFPYHTPRPSKGSAGRRRPTVAHPAPLWPPARLPGAAGRAGAEQDRARGERQRDILDKQRVGEGIERREDLDGQPEVAERGDISVMFGDEAREVGIGAIVGADAVDGRGRGGAAEGVGEVVGGSDHPPPLPVRIERSRDTAWARTDDGCLDFARHERNSEGEA